MPDKYRGHDSYSCCLQETDGYPMDSGYRDIIDITGQLSDAAEEND